MIRYKSNKQAFVMTAMVILLCLACLSGATLALFTSDLDDGTIGIVATAGDVEVDIVDTSGNSLKGQYLEFVSSSGNKNIEFEPGATFCTQGFKIKNTGNVKVNYKLSIGKDNVIDIKGEPVDIALFETAFEVWITTQPTRFADAEDLKFFLGELGIDDDNNTSDTYFLVVRMKESADNRFQSQAYRGIGVTVYAVQSNGEIKE